jgi:hypothetical protein
MKPTVKENKIVLGVTTRGRAIRSIFCFAIAAQRMPLYPNANPNRSISISISIKINEYHKTLGELKKSGYVSKSIKKSCDLTLEKK